MTNATVPVWFEPTELEDWPTRAIESADLRYRLRLHRDWDARPQVSQTPMEVEHVFRGAHPAECLVVSFMDKADPAANLRNWVEAIVGIAGFPVLTLSQAGRTPKLLQWQYAGSSAPLADRLEVDEAHTYQGVGMLPGRPPELARVYILLARRATLAWKVALSFMTACPPGVGEELVADNDHVRAGATFGRLRLL